MKNDRAVDRRRFLQTVAAAGGGMAVFARALEALAGGEAAVTPAMIQQAEWISGLEFSQGEREMMLEGVNGTVAGYRRLRQIPLDNGVAPALELQLHHFPPATQGPASTSARWSRQSEFARPDSEEELCFLSVRELASLLRRRQISCVELTRSYLGRLERLDPLLHCVIHSTSDLALRQAGQADRELAAGTDRGPLHGIPWGAKDLLAVPGYPTTWGAQPYRDQVRHEKASVVRRLEDAGAVLVAKLSLGALAWGDVWFDAMTRNPWNPDQGASGSSAGSAAATAAGLVGFSIGSETWGSIVSPCTRCGVTGLRPTFGRVSRFGAMALSWSMDKLGPIARSVEDCALVFAAIQGRDGIDTSVVDAPFSWPVERDLRQLKLGYLASLFERDRTEGVEDEQERQRLETWQQNDRRSLEVLDRLGFDLIPIELPDSIPVADLGFILDAEAAAAFDTLTRSGDDELLVRQETDAWPNVFRQAHLIPAVEYIRANRLRRLLMASLEETLADFDAWISPSYEGDNLLLTNLTGHPCVVVPNGFDNRLGPTSITFMGRLWGDDVVLALAHAYQEATDFHLRRPPLGV